MATKPVASAVKERIADPVQSPKKPGFATLCANSDCTDSDICSRLASSVFSTSDLISAAAIVADSNQALL